jgi:4-aminobutyrate aminotransferase-like enzyme/Ser/Thr protein kinase RdoA (MazF antagonist)
VTSIVNHAPAFTLEQARLLAKDLYGLDGEVQQLPSERDQNFLIHCASGEQFVMKIANATEDRAMLEAQNQVMKHVSRHEAILPSIVALPGSEEIEAVPAAAGSTHFVRLVTYLPGNPMGSVKRHTPELLYDLGQKLGILDLALQDFDHPALHRDFYWDFSNGLKIITKNLELVGDQELRNLVGQVASKFEKFTAPFVSNLRKSVIYNDANDYNVLVGGDDDIYTRNQHVKGFIDLGDMLYGTTIGDLAIAIAYAILDKPQPLAAAAEVVKGYHSVFPLREEELSALFGLVTLRLGMSVCIAAEQQQNQPQNHYLSVSQIPIRNTLPGLVRIHPRFAEAVFREACGLAPFATAPETVEWLQANALSFAPVLPFDLCTEPLAVFDLSIGSPILHGNPRENQGSELTKRLHQQMKESGVKVGIGRYDEARYLYIDPAFATGDRPTDEFRTVHLGVDLFVEAGTPVHAPLDGKVMALADNAAPRDYGPVIVLAHEIDSQHRFYTLYGHLNRKSIAKLKVGQKIKKGKAFAKVGKSKINGGWTPHLHFQIMNDSLELGSDFPGVALPSQRKTWLSLCPDPNLILRIPADAFPERCLTKEEILAQRRDRMGGNVSISYRSPLKIVRGWMQYLFDEDGRRFIDAYNNVAHVGHCHPRVVQAAREQIGVLNTNTRYLHDNIIRYAERLTALLPKELEVCYFVNSASEANELALRLARAFTSQRDMIVLDAAYHGNTTSLIDISPYKHNGPGGQGAPDWVHAVPIPDLFRGEYRAGDPNAAANYAAHVKQVAGLLREQGRGLSGFIAESLPSVGGQIVFPDGYLADVYRYVHEAGGLCIADEVQTGFGRVGSHLWGFEMQNVVPDIVVLGKPIGNGHPLAAVITRRQIADAFDNGMEYFTTFGGNPVSCAVGLAVLDVLQEEALQAHAARVGNILLNGLKSFVGKYRMVADARGAGLFLGMELVRDPLTLEPAAEEASFIANRMREHGVLLGTDGPYHNVVKIRPPMPLEEADADYLLTTFEKILKEDFSK